MFFCAHPELGSANLPALPPEPTRSLGQFNPVLLEFLGTWPGFVTVWSLLIRSSVFSCRRSRSTPDRDPNYETGSIRKAAGDYIPRCNQENVARLR